MQQRDARQADPEPAFWHLARVGGRLAFELHTPSAAKRDRFDRRVKSVYRLGAVGGYGKIGPRA
jgi:hypothetical protein